MEAIEKVLRDAIPAFLRIRTCGATVDEIQAAFAPWDQAINRDRILASLEVLKAEPLVCPQGASHCEPNLGDVLVSLVGALEQRVASCVSAIQPEGLSKNDAARFLGVEERTIEHLIRTRQLEYVQIGSQRGRVVPVASLQKLIRDNKQLTAKELLGKRKRR